MKINIEIDCTPAEARTFMGLPDLAPLQAELVAKLQRRLNEFFDEMSPETLAKYWFSGGAAELGNLQKKFWSHFAGAEPDKT